MTRKEVIQIRVSPEEKTFLKEAAGDKTLSDYIREKLISVEFAIDFDRAVPVVQKARAIEERRAPEPRPPDNWICQCPTFNRNPSTTPRCQNCGMERPSAG